MLLVVFVKPRAEDALIGRIQVEIQEFLQIFYVVGLLRNGFTGLPISEHRNLQGQ